MWDRLIRKGRVPRLPNEDSFARSSPLGTSTRDNYFLFYSAFVPTKVCFLFFAIFLKTLRCSASGFIVSRSAFIEEIDSKSSLSNIPTHFNVPNSGAALIFKVWTKKREGRRLEQFFLLSSRYAAGTDVALLFELLPSSKSRPSSVQGRRKMSFKRRNQSE